jgi:ABC-type multidrug transport system fused ATPase/permease subunit
MNTNPEISDGGLEEVRKSAKQLVQITWTDIVIKAIPPTGRCKPEGSITKEKIIIDNVDGTVMPGQFLAIIGASGKKQDRS